MLSRAQQRQGNRPHAFKMGVVKGVVHVFPTSQPPVTILDGTILFSLVGSIPLQQSSSFFLYSHIIWKQHKIYRTAQQEAWKYIAALWRL